MIGLKEILREALVRWRGEELAAVEPIPGGANSEIFRLRMRGGAEYCVKRYPRRRDDPTDRLGTEFAALSFLWGQGLRQVPEPVGALGEEGIGVYGFIHGRRIARGEVTGEILRQAAEFFLTLHGLRRAPGAGALPSAKEACFSLADQREMLLARLQRVRDLGIREGDGPGVRLRSFLGAELGPLCERVTAGVIAAAARRGLDPDAELPPAQRTLSPSDVGFHNTLVRADGTLAFVDFEYFGWDDPAKLVSDFFLQPQVPLPPERREPFLRRLFPGFGDEAGFRERLALVYPLLALKWCLIMLNIFLRPALPGREGLENREAQLARAEGALAALRMEFENLVFPNAPFGI